MEIAGIPLRDVVLVLSGLAGIYLVIMLLRLVQVGRHRDQAIEDDELEQASDDEAVATDAPVPEPLAGPAKPRLVEKSSGFGAELTRSQQDSELRQLREEVAQLREEVGLLRADVSQIKAARYVSPQYADAMALAPRCLSGQELADRCGISLGEAELVWALSRGPTQFDEEEDYGGEPGLRHARSA